MADGNENVADGTVGDRGRAVIAGHQGDEQAARSLLRHGDADVRASALGALARMDRLADDDVTAGMADPSPVVRRRSISLAIDRPAVSLRPLLDDTDHTVIEQAAWACGERTPPEPGVVDELARLATAHADPLVREAAVAALGAIGDAAGLTAILAATEDKPAIRRRAVLALAPFDGPEVDRALARALEDRDWQVRQAAQDIT
jgi:HEAT repeat protein